MSFLNFYSIAQIVTQTDFEQLFENAYNEGAAIDAQWLTRWDDIFTLDPFGSGSVLLYPALSLIGLIIAVMTLCFLMVRFGRELMDSNFANALPELIWPLIAVLLLSLQIVIGLPSLASAFSNASICPAPNGVATVPTTVFPSFASPVNNLARIILEIRNVMDLGNRFVMTQPFIVGADTGCNLQRQAQVIANGTSVIQGYFKECSAKPPGQDSEDCYVAAAAQSRTLVLAYENTYGAQPWTTRF
jgi:hypothetical protein